MAQIEDGKDESDDGPRIEVKKHVPIEVAQLQEFDQGVVVAKNSATLRLTEEPSNTMDSAEQVFTMNGEDEKPSPVTEEELPELAVPPQIAPIAALPAASEPRVLDDTKTPPHGHAGLASLPRRDTLSLPAVGDMADAATGQSGLSIPDGEPVTEDPKPPALPGPPGRHMTDELLATMNKQDEADPKTDQIELRALRPVGVMVKSDPLLLRSKTRKPFEKDRDIRRKARELWNRMCDLEDQGSVLLEKRWELETRARLLRELLDQKTEEQKATREKLKEMKESSDAAKIEFEEHAKKGKESNQLAEQEKERIQAEFDKLANLSNLVAAVIVSGKRVFDASKEDDLNREAILGSEKTTTLLNLIEPLMDLPKNMEDFITAKQLELQHFAQSKALLKKRQDLKTEYVELQQSMQPFEETFARIKAAIGEAEDEVQSVKLKKYEIDRELKELQKTHDGLSPDNDSKAEAEPPAEAQAEATSEKPPEPQD